MIDLLALLCDKESRAQVELACLGSQRAGRQSVRIEPIARLTLVRADMRRSRPAGVLIDPNCCGVTSDDEAAHVIGEFLAAHPEIPVVVWSDSSWFEPRRVIALAEKGLREVIIRGEEDAPQALAQLISRLLSCRRAKIFLEALPPPVPSDLTQLIESFVIPTMKPATPAQMARSLCCERTKLYRDFQAAGLPPPRTLLGWIRIYLVLYLIEEEGLDPEIAAMKVGFVSRSGFVQMAARRLAIAAPDTISKTSWRDVLVALHANVTHRRKSMPSDRGKNATLHARSATLEFDRSTVPVS